MNFARNYVDDLVLPLGVERVLYMDTDTIVKGDVLEIWDTEFGPNKFFGPADSCSSPHTTPNRMKGQYDFRHKMIKATMKPTDCYINAGVYLLDVTRYRDAKVNKRIAKLIEERNRRGKTLWKTGVHQPSFILALYNHTQKLPGSWNQGQLGWNPRITGAELRASKVLHWNGGKKPWCCRGLYPAEWAPYALNQKNCCECTLSMPSVPRGILHHSRTPKCLTGHSAKDCLPDKSGQTPDSAST
mmetsp:Transcript_4613/g.16518  ORF Transcript_4613/g.16518 Transcript_4613/m.16518 type:complete len:243 (+) Transcript_4613:789-1517(+)